MGKLDWNAYEKRVKQVTRPCVPRESTPELAFSLGYAHTSRISNCLDAENPNYFSAGRWWKLMEELKDHRPAITMMTQAGYTVAYTGDVELRGDIERALLIATGKLVAALADARDPKSEGGEEITPNEYLYIRPLAMDIQKLAGYLLGPTAARYSLGCGEIVRKFINNSQGETK